MDDGNIEMIVCRECERPTCEPPDELMEFKGLCPGCVIRQEVFPLLPARFRDLVDSILEARDDQLMNEILNKMGGTGGVAIVVGVGGDKGEDMAEKVMETFKHIIMHDKEARAKLKEVISVLDDHDKDCGQHACDHKVVGGRPDKPVVRNDPRTG